MVFNRFRVPGAARPGFEVLARDAVEFYRSSPGCLAVELVQSLDEDDLWALASTWQDVGSYRRCLGGYDSKMILMPLMAFAMDEASAYGEPDEVGLNQPREV